MNTGVMRRVCGVRCDADDHDPGDEWVCTLPPHRNDVDHVALVIGGMHRWPNTVVLNPLESEDALERYDPGAATAGTVEGRIVAVLGLVRAELIRATSKFGSFASQHEGLARENLRATEEQNHA